MARRQYSAATLTQVKSTGNGTAGTNQYTPTNKTLVPGIRYPNNTTAPGVTTDFVYAEGVRVDVSTIAGYGLGLDAPSNTKYYNPKVIDDPRRLT